MQEKTFGLPIILDAPLELEKFGGVSGVLLPLCSDLRTSPVYWLASERNRLLSFIAAPTVFNFVVAAGGILVVEVVVAVYSSRAVIMPHVAEKASALEFMRK